MVLIPDRARDWHQITDIDIDTNGVPVGPGPDSSGSPCGVFPEEGEQQLTAQTIHGSRVFRGCSRS